MHPLTSHPLAVLSHCIHAYTHAKHEFSQRKRVAFCHNEDTTLPFRSTLLAASATEFDRAMKLGSEVHKWP
jgi:hypothetical protein